MLKGNEVEIMRKNAKIHKKVFDAIREMVQEGTSAAEVDKLCGEIAKKHNVLCGFRGTYGFPNNICISVNEVVAHGVPRKDLIFKNGDLVNFDFGIRDKQKGINTDAGFSMVIGGPEKNPAAAKLLQANIKALNAGIAMAQPGNTIGDIGHAVEKSIKADGYHVIKDLSGHAIGKAIHEKPYIYNYGKPGTGAKLKVGMTICIEPLLGETTGDIYDEGGWELYVADGSLGCQVEHLIYIGKDGPEILV